MSTAWDMTTGRVGPPIASSEIKLVSWEEGKDQFILDEFYWTEMRVNVKEIIL